MGGDLAHSSFLLGVLGHLDIGYPIGDKVQIGAGVHGGFLAIFGGLQNPLLNELSSMMSQRNHGLIGGHAFIRFKTSTSTDLSFYVGGTGIIGENTSGSLICGVRFTVALPKLQIEEKSKAVKKTESESKNK